MMPAPRADADLVAVTPPGVGTSRRYRRRVASDPDCVAGKLRLLATDPSRMVRTAVLANPACPADVLHEAVQQTRDGGLLRRIAANPNSPQEVFEYLIGSGEAPRRTRLAAAHNRSSPPEVLGWLSADWSAWVQCAVAANPCAPAAAVQRLARSSDRVVRNNAASNTSCPPETLAVLCSDRYVGVRATAARNPNCPPEALTTVAADRRASWQQRAAAAANPACPPQARQILAADRNQDVRAAAAANPASDPVLLVQLAGDKAPRVGMVAVRNPGCPPEALEAAYQRTIGRNRHWHSELRRRVAEHADTPPAVLEALTRGSDRAAAAAAAGNLFSR